MEQNSQAQQSRSDRLALLLFGISILLTIPLSIAANRLDEKIKLGFFDNWPTLPWLLALVCFVFALFFLFRSRKYRDICQRAEIEKRQLEESLPEEWKEIDDYTGLTGYKKKLEGSPYHPRTCMPAIVSRLDFMGHGASKWTSNQELLEEMLGKTKDGEVRFLLRNPIKSDEDLEDTTRIAESLMILLFLHRRYPHLKIKVYDHPPQFRLMFIDEQKLVVGHYKGYKRGDSKDTPLQVYEKRPDWSFYHAYLSHFVTEWNDAHAVDWGAVRNLAVSGRQRVGD